MNPIARFSRRLLGLSPTAHTVLDRTLRRVWPDAQGDVTQRAMDVVLDFARILYPVLTDGDEVAAHKLFTAYLRRYKERVGDIDLGGE